MMRFLAVGAGAVAGSYWYAVNLAHTGHFFGDQSAQQNVTATLQPRSDVVTAYGILVDTLDVSGARGRDILLYVIAAAIAAAIGFAYTRSRWTLAILALGLVPLLVLPLAEHVARPGLVRLADAVNDPHGYLGVDTPHWSPTFASDTASWFGPIGLICVTGTLAVAVVIRRRGTTLLFAAAPVAWFLLVAITLSYNPFLGRFFIFPVALSAVLWGSVLRWPFIATGLTVLAVVTAGLSLVHYAEKPSGVRLLDRTPTSSVWRMPRWEVQSQHDPALAPVLAFFDESVPTHASVALALSDNGFGYPVFGLHLTRHVELVPQGSTAAGVHADWLYASRDRAGEIDATCWHAELQSQEGSVFKRAGNCPSA